MNKLRVLLVAVALLTAACGATTISGSQVRSVSSSGNVRVDAGANAGTDVSNGAENSDLGRINPTIRKGPSGPAPVQSQAPTQSGAEPTIVTRDRCNGGIGTDQAGSRASVPGHKIPLPECAVQ